jgi:hypothetical protein
MKTLILTIIFSIMIFQLSYCQSNFWKNVKVRKAFESKTEDDDKAANLSFTFPRNKPDFFVINAGAGYEFGNTSSSNVMFKNSFTGFFVFNRNNEIDKDQKNFKVGITSNQTLYIDTGNSVAIFGANTVEYIKNYIDTANSFLFTTYWYPFLKKPNVVKLGGYSQNDDLIAYYFLPQIGLEYQKILEQNKTSNKGFDFRAFFRMQGSLLLKMKTYNEKSNLLPKNRWKKGIELNTSYEGRASVARNSKDENSYVPMFKSELLFYPSQNNQFSVGLSYNTGANPIEGLVKQTFWLLALKFKK